MTEDRQGHGTHPICSYASKNREVEVDLCVNVHQESNFDFAHMVSGGYPHDVGDGMNLLQTGCDDWAETLLICGQSRTTL